MQPKQLIQLFSNLTTWKRGGQRAPHKPLLVLFSLGRIYRGEPRFISYMELKDDLKQLLKDFGPHRHTYYSRFPFVRLCNDGIWELKGIKNLDTRIDWSEHHLIDNETIGGFTKEVYNILKENPNLIRKLAEFLLEQNFPNTIHQDILQAVGLEIELINAGLIGELHSVTHRDPKFRDKVLKAYEYSCAVCGFNVRLGNTLIAVEAAHIKWHQAGGPDQEENGIALCSMHHKLFDRGAFTLDKSLTFLVAEEAHGTRGLEEWLLKYHGKQVRFPQSPTYYPKESFINWHVREVFKSQIRYF